MLIGRTATVALPPARKREINNFTAKPPATTKRIPHLFLHEIATLNIINRSHRATERPPLAFPSLTPIDTGATSSLTNLSLRLVNDLQKCRLSLRHQHASGRGQCKLVTCRSRERSSCLQTCQRLIVVAIRRTSSICQQGGAEQQIRGRSNPLITLTPVFAEIIAVGQRPATRNWTFCPKPSVPWRLETSFHRQRTWLVRKLQARHAVIHVLVGAHLKICLVHVQ
ncbi:hypothetical protein CC80DRAFT_116342 [Byssothecium circinans]|uniref:Uncharacterized protein n=1 Tax=Byssothecium circinans TaxID=147558 RepID=A0A6A5TSU7_9PLEO|nr:hypothetical protein CC80DRAFT_116342 [Byssothecium circinans]